MDDILSAALSTDNAIRRRAEATLSYLRTQRGFSVALAKRLSRTAAGGDADDPGGQIGSLAGVLLQHFVTDLWEVANHSLLPREDKAQVRTLVLTTMVDFAAAPSARASASRVVALMAAGGEWPDGWGGLIPSLLGQLALAAATVTQAAAGGGEGGGGDVVGGAGLGTSGGDAVRSGGGGARSDGAGRGAGGAAAVEAVEIAVARAQSCAKCLQYMTEEVPMELIPELFQQAFPGLVQAGKADYLPRDIRARVFRIVRELFTSVGTLVSVRGETRLLPGLKQCVPPWLQLVSKTLQSAVDNGKRSRGGASRDEAGNARDESVASSTGAPDDSGRGGEDGDGRGQGEFGVELEGLRTAMVLLAHVPSVVGDGHLGQLLPPLWELLTNGLERHERSMFLQDGGGAARAGGEDEEGYTSDGERQGFQELMVQALELLAAIAACSDPQVSGLLGGEGAGVGSLLAVVIRYLQLPDESCSLWQDSPNEFVIADLEEGEAEDLAGVGAAAGGGGVGGGRPGLATARSAGLALIRDLCEAFPEKAVPALIAEAKSALVDSAASTGGGGGGGGEGPAGGAAPPGSSPEAAAAAVSARRWRLREAALLCLGAASKPITRQVKRRCPLAVKLKKQHHGSSSSSSSSAHKNHHDKGTKHGDNHAGSGCSTASGMGEPGGPGGGGGGSGGGCSGGGGGGGGGDGGKCKHKKQSGAFSFSPGTLCRGARALGLDLGGFQAVIVAAAEGRSHHAEEPSSPFVQARGLWATAKFASLLSAEGVCRAAEACALAMGEGRPLCLRLHACRALQVLGQYSARIARKGGFFGIKRGAGKALLGSRVGAAAREAVTAAPALASCCEEGTAHFAPETMTQLVKGFPAEAVGHGGALVLIQLSMNLWGSYPSDPLVVEAVEDLLLALARVPQAVPQMTQTVVPSFSQVFDRVRAGEELLHPIAEGCLSLLRELIRCSTAGATSAAAAPGKSGGRRSRKGGRGNGGGSGGASTLDAAGKSSLLAGLRGAFPLLMETDSHSLVQDGCSTLQEFVTAFGSDMDGVAGDRGSGSGSGSANEPYVDKAGTALSTFGGGEAVTFPGSNGFRPWSEATPMSGETTPATGGGGGGGGSGGAWVQHGPAAGEGSASAFSLEGGKDTALSLVLAFIARVMAPTAHEASALRTGGLVSAVLRCVPPRSLGQETVQSLLGATFDKLERCSSSLLGDELLQIFVNFVNSGAYGPTALADAFVEIEGRRRRAGVGVGAGVGADIGSDGTGNGNSDDSPPGREAMAAAVMATKELAPRPLEGTEAPTATAVPPPSYPFRVSNGNAGGGGGGGGGVLLLSASPPFLSVDRRPAGLAAGLASRAVGRGEDDAMASLRRLIGLWLFYHEMVRSSSLAKRSALGLLGLLKAASEGDARLYTLRVSTDSMGSGTAARGAGLQGRCLPPSLRRMEGELLPVCLLSSIVRTAERDGEVDSLDEDDQNDAANAVGAAAGGERFAAGCEDGDEMFSLDDDDDAYMAEEGEESDGDPEDDSDDSYEDDEDDDDDESDTEDVTDDGEMALGGGDVDHPPLAVGEAQPMAGPPSATPAMGHVSMSLPNMSVDRGRLLAETSPATTPPAPAWSPAGFPCFTGGSGSGLTRCSSSSNFSASATTTHIGSLSDSSGCGGTTRVSSAPTAGYGGGQQLSTSCPRDTRWSMMSASTDNPGGSLGSYSSQRGAAGGEFLSTIHDSQRNRRHQHHRQQEEQQQQQQQQQQETSQAPGHSTAAAGAAAGGAPWDEVKKNWSQGGVGLGLVRFLRSTTGTRSEALLCGWAGLLPAEEQAKLTALLRHE